MAAAKGEALKGLKTWISKQAQDDSKPSSKASKDEIVPIHGHDTVLYMDASEGPFRCDHCEYFKAPGSCELVAGSIDPAACCSLYEKK